MQGSRQEGLQALRNDSIGFYLDGHSWPSNGRRRGKRAVEHEGIAAFDGMDDPWKVLHISKLMQVRGLRLVEHDKSSEIIQVDVNSYKHACARPLVRFKADSAKS
jgi:hypothetical protein